MSQTIVIKIGTSSLTRDDGLLALPRITALVETISDLRNLGHRIVLVSSGAVGVGSGILGLTKRPDNLSLKQAAAAVGQGKLMRVYDDLFSQYNQKVAQVLLTRQDLIRQRSNFYIFNTFNELLNLDRVIPIVNENDTVAVEELKFGDNDTLSALVAQLIEADWLFLLTDVDRLYTADPRQFADAQPISQISSFQELAELGINMGDRGSQWGTGGMVTKISAARIATNAGVRMAITHGAYPERIKEILAGEPLGTQFLPQVRLDSPRKRQLANKLEPIGRLYLDAIAVHAIRKSGKSLLAAGIKEIDGDFQSKDLVLLCDLDGVEIARGLVNYNSDELLKIKGKQSQEIGEILGYTGSKTVVHRDNLVINNG